MDKAAAERTAATSDAWRRVHTAFENKTGYSINPNADTVCPGPGHGSGMLSVAIDEGGNVGLYCHGACRTEDVVVAVGLRMSDLFNAPARPPNSVSSIQGTKGPRIQGDIGTNARVSSSDEKKSDAEMDGLLEAHAAGRIAVEPDRAPEYERVGRPEPELRVLEFYELCVALRRWAGMPEPYDVPFAQRWVARWTGLPKMTVQRALDGLRRPRHPLATQGALFVAGEMERRGQPRGTYLFRPGWLVDAEPETATGGVVAGGPELHEELGEDGAVAEAVAPDVGEALEVGDGLSAAAAEAGGAGRSGRHHDDHKPMPGGWNSDPDCPF